MGKQVWLIAVAFGVSGLAACGSKPPAQQPTGPTIGAGGEMHDDRVGGEGQMITPENMDSIKSLLDRKRNIVSHCLAIAVDNRELPKNARGKVTIEFNIGADGHSDGFKVIDKSLDSKSLEECIIGHVKEIQFPMLKHQIQYSYGYAFEAM